MTTLTHKITKGILLGAAIKGGHNKKEAMAKIDEHYEYVMRVYPDCNSPKELMNIIHTISVM
jgi:hypothetical protein